MQIYIEFVPLAWFEIHKHRPIVSLPSFGHFRKPSSAASPIAQTICSA